LVGTAQVDDGIMSGLKATIDMKNFEINKLKTELNIQRQTFAAMIAQLEVENERWLKTNV
jgi:hypothetical protein